MILFEEFIKEVEKKAQAFFGDEYKVAVRAVQKNNHVILHGLTALTKDRCISPTIYLEPYYQAFCEGSSYAEIMLDIYNFYEQYKLTDEPDFQYLEDYEKVKGQIFHKLIHYEENKELLEDVPYERFLDLALVCYIQYRNDVVGDGIILIHTGQLDGWGIRQETLFADAMQNTENKMKIEILNMGAVVQNLLEMYGKDTEESRSLEEAIRSSGNENAMFILKYESGHFGAVSLYHDKVMQNFAETCKSSFYILPSSVHELVLIPDNGTHTADSLQSMVAEVNEGCVAKEERLSDNVYYYNAETKEITCCFS